jgi:transcriptional regulator with XRE-family HTH domain
VQKYEKGVNRISASKLQQISHFLQAPIPFFFEELSGPAKGGKQTGEHLIPAQVSEFIASPEGLSLIKEHADQAPPPFAKLSSHWLRNSPVSWSVSSVSS